MNECINGSNLRGLVTGLCMVLCFGCAAPNSEVAYSSTSKTVAAERPKFVPSLQLIQTLEALIRVPKGADPLSSYIRFYSGAVEGGEEIVYGDF